MPFIPILPDIDARSIPVVDIYLFRNRPLAYFVRSIYLFQHLYR